MPSVSLSRAPSPPTPLPFVVRTMGHIHHDPYHSTLGTYHQDVMLTITLSGSGRYNRAGQSFAVTAGLIGLVLPDKDPGLLMADPRDAYDHYYCRFAGREALAIANRVVQNQRTLGMSPAFPFFRHPAFSAICDIFARTLLHAIHWRHEQNPDRMSPVDARLAEILTLLDAPAEASPRRPTAYALQLYLHDHLAAPVDLAAMADYFSISKAHLCRVARKELGRTLQSLWEQVKMDRARVLLTQSDLSIKEVARRVGYVDPFYFSNVFRRATGSSPSHFRQGAAHPAC